MASTRYGAFSNTIFSDKHYTFISFHLMNAFKSLRKVVFESPQFVILTISLLWGLCLIFTIPPFQSPDEEIHFLRSWAMSRGSLISKKFRTDIGTIKGYEAPICAIEVIEKTGFSKIVFHPEKSRQKTDLESIKRSRVLPRPLVFRRLDECPESRFLFQTSCQYLDDQPP
jgi:hypothetical protein